MGKIYSYDALPEVIPEGPPLLMIDRLEIDGEAGRAVGIKAVSMDEAFFQGHFPGGPIMPGVLQVAAMFQISGAVIRAQGGPAGVPWLSAMKRIKFRRPVMPGDLMRVETQLKETDGTSWTFQASTQVGGETACSGTLVLTVVDPLGTAVTPSSCDAALPPEWTGIAVDMMHVLDMIPHRYPFVFLDRIAVLDLDGTTVGIKNVTAGEPWFRGAAMSAFPGYLQIEAAAQVACAVALQAPCNQGKIGYFMSVDEATFTGMVLPGDQLVMQVDVAQRGRFGMADARLQVAGGGAVAQTSMKFAIVDRT